MLTLLRKLADLIAGRVRRQGISWFVPGLLCGAICLGLWGLAAPDAVAQSSGGAVIRPAPGNSTGFRPLFRLFGFGETKRPARTRTSPSEAVKRPRAANTAPAFQAKPKDPDAGVILVAGDQMAKGVAEGLRYTLADKSMVRVDTLIHEKSGLAGAGVPDWGTEITARIRGEDVKAVVLMMGRHDLAVPFAGEPPVEFATADWEKAYSSKVSALVSSIRQERKQLIWVGLPPTGNPLTNTDFTLLNSLFQAGTEENRGKYVDVWDIFLTENGEYDSFGPDVDGKRARLRDADKVGFTWDGYRKVAFFVERELSRLLGGYGGMAFEGVEDDPNFIVLTGRTTAPEDQLLGGQDGNGPVPYEGVAVDAARRFFILGEARKGPEGRADSTVWKAPGGS
ncbi:SGNH/GDSL hydrolase family protein [Roseibium litorale]|uniref:SGNH/GDSL hydrolase family protein n=1 Tax=Roseibium litorale TaxID=2803841 RepID=UPI001AD9419B